MNVNWYSYHVKPILDFNEMGGIIIARDGELLNTYQYDKDTNEVLTRETGELISLSDPTVDGWCYVNDLYPKKTVI